MLARITILWAIFAAVMGFAVGGSFVWAMDGQPNQNSHVTTADPATNPSSNQHQPSKTFGERLSIIWDRTWEDPVAFYTFVLGIFTFLLVAVSAGQGWFLFRADKTARITANAANLSARAAVAIELPVIRASVDGLGFGTSREGSDPQKYYCSINYYLNFANFGRTQAFPINVQCGWFVGDKLPDAPNYTFTKSFPVNTVFKADPKTTGDLRIDEFMFETTSDIYERLRTRAISLWFFCSIAYLDFMQTRHDAGFCWKRIETFGAGNFAADATPAYNRKT